MAVAGAATAGAERGGNGAAALFVGPATFVVLAMLVAPLILIARYSLNKFDPTELMIAAATPENYLRFFTDAFYLSVMRTTIFVAVVVTVICLACGMPLALRLARLPARWKSLAILLTILPLFTGSVVRTLGWLILFAHGGMLDIASLHLFGRNVDLMYGTTSVVIAIASVNLPFMILTLQSVFEGIDTRMEEAARGLGATPARAFFRVTWPIALPGTIIAAILCFTLAMNAYATPVLVGGPRFAMMAPVVYYEFANNNNWPFAGALAIILMVTTLVLAALANRAFGRRA
jgi:putative spermidine/putrescine transport system permease protein